MQLRHSVLLALTLTACSAPVALGTGAGQAPTTHATRYEQTTARMLVAEKTGGPAQAREFRLSRMRDENGQIDPYGRRTAIAQRKANLDHWQATDGGGIGNYSWVELGPDNIGGRTRSILVHPTIPSRLYAGSVSGGVWRSDNSGASWYPLDDLMGNLAICSMAFDPANPNIIYAGTGEGVCIGNQSCIAGEGLWRTTDAGTTWTQLANTANFGSINRIAVSHTNSNVILLATSNGIRRSSDGGGTWTTVRSGNSYQVLIDPNNSARCVAHYRGGPHGIAYSTDGGVTWTNAGGGFPTTNRIELAYAPSVSNRVYASCPAPPVAPATNPDGQCWRSDDGGQTWVNRTVTPIVNGNQWWYDNCIWVDPTNSNWVVIGAVSVWRSSDGGQNFTRIGGGTASTTPHVDFHFFAHDPNYDGSTNRTLWVANDGGVFRATDIRTCTTNSGWVRCETDYRTIQYYGVAGHSSGRDVGGTQDQGSHTINTSTTSSAILTEYTADGSNSQIDPTDPNYIWGSKQNLGVFRSTDGGLTTSGMTSGLGDTGMCSNFIAPLVLSQFNPNVLYAGGCSLWRCSNAKAASPTWTNIKASIGSRISAIAVSPNSSNIVWVGHNDGRVYRTTNALSATPTWITVDDNSTVSPFPSRQITRILIDRATSNRALVAQGSFVSNNLWRTTNATAASPTWTDATGTGVTALPSAPIYGLAQHPTLAGRYYVASEVGVFGTSDDCATWSTSNDGPADVSCDDITFMSSTTLLVGTHGRGMWSTTISEPSVTDIGAGCAGTNGTPSLAATDPRIGLSVTITASNLVANQPVWLAQGQSSSSWFGTILPADLAAFGAPGCFLRIRPDIVRDGFSDGSGNFSGELPIAANTSLLGQVFYLQLFPGDLAANTFGRTTSNALRLVIGN